ncbi:MAG: hypothetical protein AAF467_12080 [Actinomycetota bacterium]
MAEFELHHPTGDVEVTVRLLLESDFWVVETKGGAGESFGNQLIRLSDGSFELAITRD